MKAVLVGLVVLTVALPVTFFLLSFDTQYAPGYSERAFKSIKPGDTQERVVSLVGNPISSQDSEPFLQWLYSDHSQPEFSQTGRPSGSYTIFTFKDGVLDNVFGKRRTSDNSFVAGPAEGYLKISAEEVEKLKGASTERIKERFGPPVAINDYKAVKILSYSRSPSKSNYHLRMVGLDAQGKVVRVWSSIYWD